MAGNSRCRERSLSRPGGGAGLNRETALMAGLLHQIGRVPISPCWNGKGFAWRTTLQLLFSRITKPYP